MVENTGISKKKIWVIHRQGNKKNRNNDTGSEDALDVCASAVATQGQSDCRFLRKVDGIHRHYNNQEMGRGVARNLSGLEKSLQLKADHSDQNS